MTIYTYSPNSAKSESATSTKKSFDQFRSPKLTSTKPKTKTLRYETVAPRFVNIRHVPKKNGGFRLEYNLANAEIVLDEEKNSLQFIQLSKLIKPINLNA